MTLRVGNVVDRVLGLLAPKASADAAGCGDCVGYMHPRYEYRCAFGQWQQRSTGEWCPLCGWMWGPWRTIGRCFN